MMKKCGVCGETVADGAIECPKCGRGVFESEKLHRDSANSVRSTPGTDESHTVKSGKRLSFWKSLFGSKEPPKDQPRSHRITHSLVLVCRSCGATFRVGVDSSIMTIEGLAPQGEKDSNPLVRILASRRREQGGFDTVGRVRLDTLPEDNPFKKQNSHEMERVHHSLARGQRRTWRCPECLDVQPYSSYGGRPETGEVSPRSVRDLQDLTLGELADPIFPYVAPNDRVNEITIDSPLHPAITARDAFVGKRCHLVEYLPILQDAANTCPHEDLPYVWLAELHLMQGKYEEARGWVFEGLRKVREFERLTYMAASVYLRMMESAAVGWFVQSCLLGTFEFTPYLFCAHCAKVAEFDDLYRRLLNASDAISPGSRVPDAEAQVVSLARRISRTELVQAMTRFQTMMHNTLPAADVFPDHPGERDIFIWAHSDDIRPDIRVKLFARPKEGHWGRPEESK